MHKPRPEQQPLPLRTHELFILFALQVAAQLPLLLLRRLLRRRAQHACRQALPLLAAVGQGELGLEARLHRLRLKVAPAACLQRGVARQRITGLGIRRPCRRLGCTAGVVHAAGRGGQARRSGEAARLGARVNWSAVPPQLPPPLLGTLVRNWPVRWITRN